MKQLLRRGCAAVLSLVIAGSLSAQAWVLGGTYNEGLAPVREGDLWGYIDAAGSLAIAPVYDSVEPFSLGTAMVVQDGKYGIIRWDGVYLIEPEYHSLTSVGYGVYVARQEETWSLLSIVPTLSSSSSQATQVLYGDLTFAQVVNGGEALIFTQADGTAIRQTVSGLPRLLQERKVPGWQFPLSPNRASTYQDVQGDDWFDLWVDLSSNLGLMKGTGNGLFEPLRSLTVAETLRLAACLESRALQDDFHRQPVEGNPWYSASVAYCEASGIIRSGEFTDADMERPVTRAEMARIFAATSPARSMTELNSLALVKLRVPDVSSGDYAADAIYSLYAKGVLTGTDNSLTFHPQDPLTRAEAAAIVSRIARPEQRIDLW